MIKPGPRNLITDVDGILVGNAHDDVVRSGTTVIFPKNRAVAGGDVRGGGPGTRETDALDPANLVDAVDAIVLSGGSVFGLDAASAVVAALGAKGRGFTLAGEMASPVVPAAILFDLANGGDKSWGESPPYHQLGRKALDAVGQDFSLGNFGAGYGAIAGAYKGGLGSASAVTPEGLQVGALVAANPLGSPVLPGSNALWPWALEQDGEFGGARPGVDAGAPDLSLPSDTKFGSPQSANANTTIGVVATNADLTPAEAKRIAMMAQDGYARSIRPIHTPFDGDTVFALATGSKAIGEMRAFDVAQIGALAADCMARAVARAVYAAETLGEMRSYRAVFGL